MPASADCVFCAIAAGAAPAGRVTGGDRWLAFLAVPPAAPGHLLVIPREHVRELADLDAETAAELGVAVRDAAVLLRDRLHPDGITIRQNNGVASGQHVWHVHWHLVPRWDGDGTIGWPRPRPDQPAPEAVLESLGVPAAGSVADASS